MGRFKNDYPPEWATLKDEVREAAGNRCARCKHPYTKGAHGNGEWSPCDRECRHRGPFRVLIPYGCENEVDWYEPHAGSIPAWDEQGGLQHAVGEYPVQAQWRILTVHHLDGDKANCRWWNIVPLCQRCHLSIQGKVVMDRPWPYDHSPWFRPYVAGYYAHVYLDRELSRDQVEARVDELLELGIERARSEPWQERMAV